MKADLDKIKWLMDNYTTYSISQETGISQTTLGPYKLGQRDYGNMTLRHATTLTELAIKKEEENKMEKLVLDMKSWEEWGGSNEYDDTLRAVGFDIPEEVLALVDEDDQEELTEFIDQGIFDNLELENVKYRPFYNQTSSKWDIYVSFDYKAEFNLGGFRPELAHITLITDGHVNREENNFTDSMENWVWEAIEKVHKEALEDDNLKEVANEIGLDLNSLDLDCYEHQLSRLSRFQFETVSEMVESKADELTDEQLKKLELAKEAEQNIYDEVFGY